MKELLRKMQANQKAEEREIRIEKIGTSILCLLAAVAIVMVLVGVEVLYHEMFFVIIALSVSLFLWTEQEKRFIRENDENIFEDMIVFIEETIEECYMENPEMVFLENEKLLKYCFDRYAFLSYLRNNFLSINLDFYEQEKAYIAEIKTAVFMVSLFPFEFFKFKVKMKNKEENFNKNIYKNVLKKILPKRYVFINEEVFKIICDEDDPNRQFEQLYQLFKVF